MLKVFFPKEDKLVKLRYDMLGMGVNVVTARSGDIRGGMAAAWATQVALKCICVCIGSQSYTRKLILKSRAFGFHVLAGDQLRLAKRFGSGNSGKIDKFKGLKVRAGRTGSPVLKDCGLWFECRVIKVINMDKDSKLIVGRIVAAGKGRRSFKPLIYRQSDY